MLQDMQFYLLHLLNKSRIHFYFTRIEMQNKTKSLSVKKMKKDTELDFYLAWERQTGLLRAKIQ